MPKLDMYDKRILELLFENSRESLNVIARKVRLSRENVDYRIKRMMKDGLIQDFITFFDAKKLGLLHYVIFVELINLDHDKERKILNYLTNSKNASWIGTSAGKWSIVFDAIIKDKSEFKEVEKFFIEFGKYIGEYVVLDVEEEDYFPTKMIGLKVKEKNNAKTKDYTLDEIDMKILGILNNDGWASFIDIGAKVKLTPNAVNKRVNNLENSGYIVGYGVSLNWKKAGWEWFGLQFKVTKLTRDINSRLTEYFRESPRVLACNKYLGGAWDYDVGIIAKSSEELREFINDFRKIFSDSVKISDVFINLEETTVYKLPKGAFE